MLYFKVRYNDHGHPKCSACYRPIPQVPAMGDRDVGQYWVATRVVFTDKATLVETLVACQQCEELNTWDWFEDPRKRTKIEPDPDGDRVTASWEARIGKRGNSHVSEGGTGQLRPRQARVWSGATRSAVRVTPGSIERNEVLGSTARDTGGKD